MVGILYPVIYGFKYTKDKVTDQSGKVVIVTGGNTGIGYETCYELVKRGAKVYLAARSESRAMGAIKRIQAEGFKGTIEWLPLDLQNLASVRTAAQTFSNKEHHLDVLYNNAGIMATPYELTKDGIECQLQTNHISPFLFTHLLLPKLEAASEPRVVTTSSSAHNFYKANDESFTSLEALNSHYGSTWKRYGQTKLSNILFSNALAERYPRILSNSCNPGNVNTELYRGPGASYGNYTYVVFGYLATFSSKVVGTMLTPPQGALTQLYLGTSDDISKNRTTGKFYVPIAVQKPPSASVTKANADRLWATTIKILADKGQSLTL